MTIRYRGASDIRLFDKESLERHGIKLAKNEGLEFSPFNAWKQEVETTKESVDALLQYIAMNNEPIMVYDESGERLSAEVQGAVVDDTAPVVVDARTGEVSTAPGLALSSQEAKAVLEQSQSAVPKP